MAVKIRLSKRGRKKLALYDIVIASQNAPRDGRFIEKVGNYNPNTNPATVTLAENKIVQWLLNGAQPTDTVKCILSSQGILLRKHLQVGVKKGAITQEEADQRLLAWRQTKAQKPNKFKLATPNKAAEKGPEIVEAVATKTKPAKETITTEVAPKAKKSFTPQSSQNSATKAPKRVAAKAPKAEKSKGQQLEENSNTEPKE